MASLNQRLAPTNRLKKPDEFKRLFNRPWRSLDSQFVVLAKQNGLPCARLGLAIAKRRINLAVNRNKVKRMVRESFRRNKAQLCGLDVLVMAQQNIAPQENTLIWKSLSRHWKKIAQCARLPSA